MSKYGNTVLWMGLILMALQLAAEWSFLRNALFTKTAESTATPASTTSPSPVGLAPVPPLTTPSGVNVGSHFPKIGPK